MSKILTVEPSVSEFWTAGGPVWINFANSQALASKGMTDVVATVEGLRWWLSLMGLPAPSQVGTDDLAFAATLRESFARVLDSVQEENPLLPSDLDLFNSVLRKQSEWYELEQVGNQAIVRKPHRLADTIEQALGPAVDSLAETLTHGDRSRLRTCARPDCVLRFYDDSKNGTRRWCTMSSCGNRAKAAAFLERKRVRDNKPPQRGRLIR
ncbi:MAG: CGNR zinc finger domain-containing protein [Fimbriimonas sp.]